MRWQRNFCRSLELAAPRNSPSIIIRAAVVVSIVALPSTESVEAPLDSYTFPTPFYRNVSFRDALRLSNSRRDLCLHKSRRNFRREILTIHALGISFITHACAYEFIGHKCELAINLRGAAVICGASAIKKTEMMLQHSSYISLWHFVLHLAIIAATYTRLPR